MDVAENSQHGEFRKHLGLVCIEGTTVQRRKADPPLTAATPSRLVPLSCLSSACDRVGWCDAGDGGALSGARPKRCRNRSTGCLGRSAKREGTGVTANQQEVPAAERDAGGVRRIPCVRASMLGSHAATDR
jgi:hypothetical protein